MQIILLENVMNLGKIGDLVKVKNGYGRNFLLKQGKALRASKENIDLVNKKKVELNKKNEEIKSQFKLIANKISNKTLKFNKEAKENGDLYGSIKPKEVSTAFMNDLKDDDRWLLMSEGRATNMNWMICIPKNFITKEERN